jgi:hypothetical protein
MRTTLSTLSVSAIVMMACWLPAHAEVTCSDGGPYEAVPATTPTANFTIHDNGTVTDTTTGLMWMRCSLKQTWDGNTCTGDADSYSWQEALQVAQDINSGSSNADNDNAAGFAGHTDWRLPNKNELASIVEDSCPSMAINAALFPPTNTIYKWFWSSSPHAGYSINAWAVHFEKGRVVWVARDSSRMVRLVRAGQ